MQRNKALMERSQSLMRKSLAWCPLPTPHPTPMHPEPALSPKVPAFSTAIGTFPTGTTRLQGTLEQVGSLLFQVTPCQSPFLPPSL